MNTSKPAGAGGYEVNEAFGALFRTFTNDSTSIGTELTQALIQRSRHDPLLVSTASDIVLFPGRGAPQVESFRRSTRGFIELTAVSHVPLSLAYVARMRELDPTSTHWLTQLSAVREQAEAVRNANTVDLWRDQVALRAFAGLESKITDMVEYTLATTCAYIDRAFANPDLLRFDALREQYFDAPADGPVPVPMNDIMFATFALAYVDIAYRIGNWLRGQALDWQRAMVLVSGRSGRPTAGATWASNNMCHLLWRTTGLPPDRLYVAPHAPGFSVQNMPDADGMVALEQSYRQLWCHTRASVEVSRRMFDGYSPFEFVPDAVDTMPPIHGVNDRAACVARLRRIMEDPQQLLSNCVADYVVDQLQLCGNRPEKLPIPGFTNVDFPVAARTESTRRSVA